MTKTTLVSTKIHGNIKEQLEIIDSRLSKLDEKVEKEIALAKDDIPERYGVKRAMSENIGSIIENAPDFETLQGCFDVIHTYLDFGDGPNELKFGGRDSDKGKKYRNISTPLTYLFNNLPETLSFVSEIDMAYEYQRVLRSAIRMIKNDSNNKWFVPKIHVYYYIISKSESDKVGVAILKQLKDMGFKKYIPDVLDVLDSMGEHEPLHLFSTLRELPKSLQEAHDMGYDRQIDSAFSLAKKIKYEGSASHGLLNSIARDCVKWQELGRLDLYEKLNKKLERVGQKNPIFNYYSVHSNLLKSFEEYREHGLEGRFLEIFEFAVSEHENDKLPLSSADLEYSLIPYGLRFFFDFPSIHTIIGDKAFELYERIKSNLDTTMKRSAVIGSLPKILKFDKSSVNHWLDYIENTSYGANKYDYHFGEMVEATVKAIKQGVQIIEYVDYAGIISSFRLENRLANLRDVISSDISKNKKREILQNYSILSHLKDVSNPAVDDDWLNETAEKMGLSYNRLIDFLNICKAGLKKDDAQPMKFFLKQLNTYKEGGVDYFKAIDLIPVFYAEGMPNEEEIRNFRHIINLDEPIDKKVEFVIKARKEKVLLGVLAPTHCDFNKWYEKAKQEMDNFIRHADNYPKAFTLKVLGCAQTERAIGLLRDIINLEHQGIHNKALFPIGKVYEHVPLDGLKTVMGFPEATRYLVYGLISRRSEKVEEASKVFSWGYISKARQFISESHIPSTLFYSQISSNLVILGLKDCPDKEKSRAARSIIESIKKDYLTSQKDIPGRSKLRLLVKQLESLADAESEFFNGLASKLQDWNLYDLGDGRRLHCCALLSNDKEASEIASLFYHADPYIGILHLSPTLSGRYLDPIGAGILVNCTDKHDNLVLGVDSFEGGLLLDSVDENVWSKTAARAIAGVAMDTNSEYVFINARNCMNGKSKRFVKLMAQTLGLGSPITEPLNKIKGDGLLNIPKGYRYLELWKNRTELSGDAIGYKLPTRIFAEMLRYAQ